uniref:Uncharacterized protein n=1 Tax=Anopheles funestus TaxID=62324 RepID=A0A182S0K2_ANOFN
HLLRASVNKTAGPSVLFFYSLPFFPSASHFFSFFLDKLCDIFSELCCNFFFFISLNTFPHKPFTILNEDSVRTVNRPCFMILLCHVFRIFFFYLKKKKNAKAYL